MHSHRILICSSRPQRENLIFPQIFAIIYIQGFEENHLQNTATSGNIGAWCNGNTEDFDSSVLGSNPDAPAINNYYILKIIVNKNLQNCKNYDIIYM